MVPQSLTDEHVRSVAGHILSHEPYSAWRGTEMILPWLERFNDWLRQWNDWVGSLPAFTQVVITGGMMLVASLLLATSAFAW